MNALRIREKIIFNEPLAQLVEHLTFNQRVGGSNPPWLTIFRGLSSAGRAPALHAGGQRFDPARLHFYFVKDGNRTMILK